MGNTEDDVYGFDLANRINNAFLEPTRIYQPLESSTITNDSDQLSEHIVMHLNWQQKWKFIKLNPRKASGLDYLLNWLLKT